MITQVPQGLVFTTVAAAGFTCMRHVHLTMFYPLRMGPHGCLLYNSNCDRFLCVYEGTRYHRRELEV